MKHGLAVLFCTYIILSYSASAGEDLRAPAEAQLADIFYSEMRDRLEIYFEDSGLAQTDIELIIDRAIDDYAHCVIIALVENPDPESRKLLKLLANGVSALEIDEEFGDATSSENEAFLSRLEPIMRPCQLAVDQESGIFRE
jgi:hypothetical protein